MNHNRVDLLLVSDVTCKQALAIDASTRRGKKMRPVAKVCKGSGYSNSARPSANFSPNRLKSFREGGGEVRAAQMKDSHAINDAVISWLARRPLLWRVQVLSEYGQDILPMSINAKGTAKCLRNPVLTCQLSSSWFSRPLLLWEPSLQKWNCSPWFAMNLNLFAFQIALSWLYLLWQCHPLACELV